MAESIVSVLVDKLSLLIEKEANLVLGVEDELIFLRDELEWIMHFLQDADNKRRKFQLVQVWVRQIRDLAYDAEDVIDTYVLRVEQQRTRNFVNKIINYWSKYKTLHRIGKQIELINTRAKRISECKHKYKLELSETTQYSAHGSAGSMLSRERRSILTAGEEFDVVGFKKESSQVVDWLTNGSSERQVISIIGMGGIGKTTLARMVCQDKDILSHFESQAMISVSQEYQVRDLLVNVLKQLPETKGREELENMDYEGLKKELSNQWKNKRYLLVTDDVWSIETWDEIFAAFPDNQKSSRVILTTRIEAVAMYVDPLKSHHLKLHFLSEDDCWKLFCKKVFWREGDSCQQDLVELGKKIVAKCDKLPLAIVVMGGLLMGKERAQDVWSNVLDSASWQLSQDSNQCSKVLLLSYIDLPYYLKSCFLYLGLYPEDFKIEAQKLILLWVAEGFVQERGKQKVEDVAEEYLHELIQRSMIQVTGTLYHGGPVKTCRVHDLLRDLAVSEAKRDRFMDIDQANNHCCTSTARRFAIHYTKSSDEHAKQFPITTTATKLQSLLFFCKLNDRGMYWKWSFGGGNNKMLKVLDLVGARLSKKGLPKEIGKLIFLRYLGLRSTRIECLPASIGNLEKLQTLDTRRTSIRNLRNELWKLKNVRHLFVNFDVAKVDSTAIKDLVGISSH